LKIETYDLVIGIDYLNRSFRKSKIVFKAVFGVLNQQGGVFSLITIVNFSFFLNPTYAVEGEG